MRSRRSSTSEALGIEGLRGTILDLFVHVTSMVAHVTLIKSTLFRSGQLRISNQKSLGQSGAGATHRRVLFLVLFSVYGRAWSEYSRQVDVQRNRA